MRQLLRAVGLLGALFFMILEAACGGHSASPTAPSSQSVVSAVPAPSPVSAGATISGTVANQSGPATSMVVGVQGTNVSAPADGTGTFTLANVPASDVTLTFTSAGVQAMASIGTVAANDKLQVAVTVTGSAATVDSQEHTTANNTVDATGTIASLDVTARSFTLNGALVVVNTDATITRGGQSVGMTALQNGDRVAVHGLMSGSTILASQVSATPSTSVPPPPPTPTPAPTPAPTPTPTPTPAPPAPVPDTTVNGTVSGLNGGCPAVTMTLAGTVVRTNSATVFTGKACSDLKNGDTVYAIGPKQGDGSIAASKIYYIAPTPQTVTVTGSIVGLSGACPSIQFTLGSTVVKTNAATSFTGSKGCSALANGDAVSVTGTQQSDGSALASSVAYTGPNPETDTYVNGAVTGLSGACPSLTFTLSGTVVHTTASTTFNVEACSAVKNGDNLYAAGPKQGDGSVLATRTYYVAPTPAPVPTPTTVSGTISSLAGTCPSVSFNVTSTLVVKANASTTFPGVGCSVMANGYAVTVVGTSQSDGSLLATSVEAAPPVSTPSPAPAGSNTGFISALSGACPALTLTVNGLSVKTGTATTYTAGHGCTELKVGDYVQASGPQGSDLTISATSLTYSTATTGLYAIGTVSSVSGACPALTIVVAGITVKTNSATTFSNFTCADVKVGLVIYTTNARQSDGSLLANYVVPQK